MRSFVLVSVLIFSSTSFPLGNKILNKDFNDEITTPTARMEVITKADAVDPAIIAPGISIAGNPNRWNPNREPSTTTSSPNNSPENSPENSPKNSPENSPTNSSENSLKISPNNSPKTSPKGNEFYLDLNKENLDHPQINDNTTLGGTSLKQNRIPTAALASLSGK